MLGFRWLLFVLLNSSAEMCAGSLVGCWILGIFATSSQVYGAHGMGVIWHAWFGASTLASWRTLGRSCDDPGTVEGTGKDPVRSRLGFY